MGNKDPLIGLNLNTLLQNTYRRNGTLLPYLSEKESYFTTVAKILLNVIANYNLVINHSFEKGCFKLTVYLIVSKGHV